MGTFLSCDWGTSSFRLRLADATKLTRMAEVTSDRGIAAQHALWKGSGRPEKERLDFYREFIRDRIEELEQKVNYSLDGVPLIISGMASSGMGMLELPYKELPFFTHDPDPECRIVEPQAQFAHKTIILSGLKANGDVMRGEETLLIGAASLMEKQEQVFIFPGTHSKHVHCSGGQVEAISTYMTGEFFHLLSRKSILAASVEKGKGMGTEQSKQSFEEGVKNSGQNLLQSAFRVRTNELFSRLSKAENYYYLSGLLIGTELSALKKTDSDLVLVADQELGFYYETAMLHLRLPQTFTRIDAGEALLKGQREIYIRYFSSEY